MITHSKPELNSKDILNVTKTLKAGKLAQGDEVKRFESLLAQYIGVKNCVAVSSGTAALHLVLVALNIEPGDEVILPSYVCTAPLNAINYTGAVPVLVDIGEDLNISVKDVKKKLSKRTRAIIVPHMFGLPAELDELLNFELPVIEDCAHAIGAEYRGKKTGSFGIAGIFSFYATKMITTGEGGAIVTNSEEISLCVSDLREYDEKPDYKVRYNYKMTDINAAIGISQLRKLEEFITRRREIAKAYRKALKNIKCKLPLEKSYAKHIYYRFVVLVKKLPQVIDALNKRGICVRRPVYKPLHQYLGLGGFKYTDYVYERALSLPIYPGLNNDTLRFIIEKLDEVIG